MNWITDSIAIGNFMDAQDRDLLAREGVRSVLGLDGTLRDVDPSALGVERLRVFDLIDGPGNDSRIFRRAIDCLHAFARDAAPVLVHCHAGRSRSVVLVAGYFVVHERMQPEDALARVVERRDANITAGLSNLLDWL